MISDLIERAAAREGHNRTDGLCQVSRRIPERWRWAHRRFAETFHFFWAPCPLCGRYSGGHEWRDIDGKPSQIPGPEPYSGRGICPWCTREGRGFREPGIKCFCRECVEWRQRKETCDD